MAMAKYDSSLAYDQVIKRGIPGQIARVVDAETDMPVEEILDLDGNPIPALISNSSGYVPPFQIEDGPALVRLRVGNLSYDLLDLTRVKDTADAAVKAAQDAERAAQLVEAPADEVVAELVQNAGTLTQGAGDTRWVPNAVADTVLAGKLADPTSDSVLALRARIESDAETVPGLIPANARSRALEGIALGDRDLNEVVEPGRYYQNFVGYATALNHYPEFKSNTVLTVRNMAASSIIMQEAYAILTNRKFYRYRRSNGEWTPWQEHGATQKSVRRFFAEEQRAYPITLTNTSVVAQIPDIPLPVLVRTGNSVELSGQLRVLPAGGGSAVTTIGTVPPDALPFNSRTRWYPQMSTGGKMYSILISPTGVVQMYNLTGAEANTTINLSASWAVKPASQYAFERVCSRMYEGTDYRRTLTDTGSWLSIIAIHGGEAEPGSSEIAAAIRDQYNASWYEWDFLKATVQGDSAFAVAHEVNSTYGDYKGSLFDDPEMMEMIIRSEDCIGIHQAADGNGTNRPAGRLTCCGGENVALRELIAEKLSAAGFPSLDNPDDFPGLQGTGPKQPHNFAKNMGVQMEISVTQYREFFTGGDLTRPNRGNTTPAFTAYKNAVSAAINEYRGA